MAQCHHQLGELEAAAGILQRVQDDRPDDLEVLIEAGTLTLDRGQPRAAEPLLRRAVALAPSRRDPNVQLLRCLQDLGDDAAIRKQQAVLKSIDDEIQRKLDARAKP